jgi:hypothetical protein
MRLAATHGGTLHLVLSDGVLSGVRVPELLRVVATLRLPGRTRRIRVRASLRIEPPGP